MRKSFVAVAMLLVLLGAGLLSAQPNKPKSVIHIVTVQWKPDATPAQIQKALTAVETMNFPGLTRVWTKPIKMQLPEGYKNIIVMEFESEAALQKYAGSDAQKKWYDVYMPIRGESRTHDVSN